MLRRSRALILCLASLCCMASPELQRAACCLGLTGGIATGKSALSAYFRGTLGLRVHDSDLAVRELYAPGGAAVPAVARIFGDACVSGDGAVDRAALSAALLERPALLGELEAAVHPLVRIERERAVADAASAGEWLVVLDVPLLFESDGAWRPHALAADDASAASAGSGPPGARPLGVDRVLCVSCGAAEQRRRALSRGGMSEEKLDMILSKQATDAFRRRHADFVADSSHPWSLSGARGGAAAAVTRLRYEAPFRAPYWSWAQASARPAAVSFDVDETLSPLFPPLGDALAALKATLRAELPALHAAMAAHEGGEDGALKAWIQAAREESPALRHDLTDLRLASLLLVCEAEGLDPGPARAAMEAFLDARAASVARHAYAGAEEAVGRLRASGLKVGTLTNGNCEVGRVPEGGGGGGGGGGGVYGGLDFSLTAKEVGAMKPDLAPFLAAAAAAGLRPGQLVHVGDDLRTDVAGALLAGCWAVYVNRQPGERPGLEDLRQTMEAVIAAEGLPPALLDEVAPGWEERCCEVHRLEDLPEAVSRWR